MLEADLKFDESVHIQLNGELFYYLVALEMNFLIMSDLCFVGVYSFDQGFACLQGGICLSSMGRPVSYERALAWKVLNEDENAQCICFMFMNWSFV